MKAVFTERTSSIADIASTGPGEGIALIDLRSTTGWKGQIVDEFILTTPVGWSTERLTERLRGSGAASLQVIQIDARRPQNHLGELMNAQRKARLAHPGGSRRQWGELRDAG